jgi:hypothetical protein
MTMEYITKGDGSLLTDLKDYVCKRKRAEEEILQVMRLKR